MHSEDMNLAYVPAAHSVHGVSPPGDDDPALQMKQAPVPATGAYVPPGQVPSGDRSGVIKIWHCADPSVENVSTGQVSHLEALDRAEYFPAGHSSHVAFPGSSE